MITIFKSSKFLILSALFFSVGLATPTRAETTGQYVDDATITAKVKQAIIADSQLSVLKVQVDTLHGTVTLSGNVDTKAQEAAAVKDAKMVDGVAVVTDNLVVTGS